MVLGLALTCGVTSARWINTPFPGFFVMANRVIASVSLPHWPVAHRNSIYQHAVVAVNDQPVATAEELYALVRRLPPGSPLTYTLQKDGHTTQVTLASLPFTLKDYFLLFVAYLFNGLALALIGIGVWFFKPATPASRALFIFGLAGGLFALTAADLYSPSWFFRLHVLGEAFFPAGLIHFALVFPVDRLRRFRSLFLSLPYLVALSLGVACEAFLYRPAAYSFIHNLCMIYAAIGGVALLGAILRDYWTAYADLIRQKIRVVLLGGFGGYVLPIALMFSSGITGGEVAVNYAAFTAFFFPLTLGFAVVKHDLFGIEALLKRGTYSLTLFVIFTLIHAFLGKEARAFTRPVVESRGMSLVADQTDCVKGDSAVPCQGQGIVSEVVSPPEILVNILVEAQCVGIFVENGMRVSGSTSLHQDAVFIDPRSQAPPGKRGDGV